MFRIFWVVVITSTILAVNADDGWCKASPQAGLPTYARCLPVDQAVARYVIEVAPIVSFGLDLKYARLQTAAHLS